MNKFAIFCGSFNPIHSAHIEIKDCAEKILGTTVYFELSITNSYKPTMDFVDLDNRTKLMEDHAYIVTKAPRFVDKVLFFNKRIKFKEFVIVVGADTWERVYDSDAHKNGDIKFFEDNSVKFLVFGRNSEIKNQDSKIFMGHPLSLNYCNNISSTEIRKNQI